MSKYCDNCKNKWHCGDNCSCDESKAYAQGRADADEEIKQLKAEIINLKNKLDRYIDRYEVSIDYCD